MKRWHKFKLGIVAVSLNAAQNDLSNPQEVYLVIICRTPEEKLAKGQIS